MKPGRQLERAAQQRLGIARPADARGELGHQADRGDVERLRLEAAAQQGLGARQVVARSSPWRWRSSRARRRSRGPRSTSASAASSSLAEPAQRAAEQAPGLGVARVVGEHRAQPGRGLAGVVAHEAVERDPWSVHAHALTRLRRSRNVATCGHDTHLTGFAAALALLAPLAAPAQAEPKPYPAAEAQALDARAGDDRAALGRRAPGNRTVDVAQAFRRALRRRRLGRERHRDRPGRRHRLPDRHLAGQRPVARAGRALGAHGRGRGQARGLGARSVHPGGRERLPLRPRGERHQVRGLARGRLADRAAAAGLPAAGAASSSPIRATRKRR